MSHTPGPWVFNGHHIYGPKHEDSKHPNGRVFVASVARGAHRADPLLDGGADRFGFDSEADVRLIAAAPDLLEALELARQFLSNGIELGYIRLPDEGDPARETLKVIEAAIAKAKGEGNEQSIEKSRDLQLNEEDKVSR
jgi:hypothetical protein